MSGIKKRKGNSDIGEKPIVFAVMAEIAVFFCGHLSAVIKKGAGLDNWSIMLMEHLQTVPGGSFRMAGGTMVQQRRIWRENGKFVPKAYLDIAGCSC